MTFSTHLLCVYYHNITLWLSILTKYDFVLAKIAIFFLKNYDGGEIKVSFNVRRCRNSDNKNVFLKFIRV